MAPPTAIVTGGCSGLGLGLTKYLLERKWNVVQADVNPPAETLDNTTFIKCDVSSWEDNAALFKQAYEWQGRLDFVALNAGIDDRDDIFKSISNDPNNPPKKPNLKTIDVDLIGPYYGCKLAAHYLSLDSKAAGKPQPGGKIVITSSAAGIYPAPFVPQYAMAKTGLVGLTRALAPNGRAVNITVNAVCPALVKTNLAPPGLLEQFGEEKFTPMSTIMRCFSELADLENVRDEDWVEKGKTGETVEGNIEELIYHTPPIRAEANSVHDEAGDRAWLSIYEERNRKFAMTDWANDQAEKLQ